MFDDSLGCVSCFVSNAQNLSTQFAEQESFVNVNDLFEHIEGEEKNGLSSQISLFYTTHTPNKGLNPNRKQTESG